ncbi:uncharacterized protein C3orf18 homolog isoform X2 [Zootermopsis nevadensis]|uniref:uncharacterized protein C3orf18 homolog isoform X2 n=1 Tax=Zootermopsis nevadensis TaxID=136037 RepID=UPI000B8EB5DA|nr:uncharacterized protein C3orf18 homolog isoform X2 [Zootermopsis nevadensis]
MVAMSDVVLNFTMILTSSTGVPTSLSPLQSTDDVNATNMPSVPTVSVDESQGMQYIIIPLGIFILLCLLAVMVYFIIRKKRLDRLRHHLMPLYNFDPTEDGEDWEVELLEEGMDHRNMHRGVPARRLSFIEPLGQ